MVLRSLIVSALLLGSALGVRAGEVRAGGGSPCEAAGREAEARHGVPGGLLLAIGVVESGRRDGAGRLAAWPWAINAEGRGRLFEGRDEALGAVRSLQAAGVQSIDVGCFQVNLLHHKAAFATLEDGFDPARNADYAARFLLALRERTGSWEGAVAHYHSAVPERGGPYRDKVMAAWGGAGAAGATAAVIPVARPAGAGVVVPMVIRTVAWVPGGGGMRVWAPSAAGQGPAVITLR